MGDFVSALSAARLPADPLLANVCPQDVRDLFCLL
jgi:hypothetical protein